MSINLNYDPWEIALRDGPLENLLRGKGGGGLRAKYKKIFAPGKIK